MLELGSGSAGELEFVEHVTSGAEDGIFVPDLESERAQRPETTSMEPVPAALAEPPAKGRVWFPGPENVVIHWPRVETLLIEELD